MPRAIVLGVNGQDGSYTAEHLLRRGYEVLGLGRQGKSRYIEDQPGFAYRGVDIGDPAALTAVLVDWHPDHLYHYAAIHGPNAPDYEPRWTEMVQVNVLSLHAVLEYARTVRSGLRIAYASSAKIFGKPFGIISEATPRTTTCLYSNTKNSAFDLIAYYRGRHAVKASNLILFNHESPRRPPGFFLADMAMCLAKARHDSAYQAKFHTLDFFADWSDAADLTDIAIDLMEASADGVDLVFASGHTWHAREAIDCLFTAHGLEYRNHVVELMPSAPPQGFFQVDTSALRILTDRAPVHDFVRLATGMADAIAAYVQEPAV